MNTNPQRQPEPIIEVKRTAFADQCRKIRADNIRRAFAQRDARKVRGFQKWQPPE